MKICEYIDTQLKARFPEIRKIEEDVLGCDNFWKQVYEFNSTTLYFSAEYGGMTFYIFTKEESGVKYLCSNLNLFPDTIKVEKSNIDKVLDYIDNNRKELFNISLK